MQWMLDAFQSNVVGRKRSSRRCCAVEGWLPLHVVWIRPRFLPSTGFRLQNVNIASGYDVIWAGLHLCLDASFAAAFIELCVAAGATLALIAATATFASSRWDNLVWLLNCCSPLHWGQMLEESGLKDQRNVDDLAVCRMNLVDAERISR